MLGISCGEPLGQQKALPTPGHLTTAKQSPNSRAQPIQPIATCYAEYFISNDKIFFPFSPPPNPGFIFALLTTCHCHITATLAVLET